MKTSKILSWLLLTFCFATTANATTYRLQRVTSVTAGNYYVFEQGGYVMINTISSYALQTTNTFSTSGLSGSENYVWTLESVTGGYRIKNGSTYLKNSDANLSLVSSGTTWTFSFQSDGTAIIWGSSSRYLGYTYNSSNEYKCYTGAGSYGYQPHSIVVYQLVEETKSSAELHFDKTFEDLDIKVDIDESFKEYDIYFNVESSVPFDIKFSASSPDGLTGTSDNVIKAGTPAKPVTSKVVLHVVDNSGKKVNAISTATLSLDLTAVEGAKFAEGQSLKIDTDKLTIVKL